MAGSNTIELRVVQQVNSSGIVVAQKWQFRTKDTIISILGVTLGSWSDWMDIEVDVVTVSVP